MNPLDWHPAILITLGSFLYLFLGGVSWAIVKSDDPKHSGSDNDETAFLAGVFWPVALAWLIVLTVAMAGPMIVISIRGRLRDKKFPKAKVVDR